MITAACPDEDRTVRVTALLCRGHSGHEVGHARYVQNVLPGITRENVKIIKESSQENSNNFYCTFLLGLGKTSPLFLLLRPPTNTQSQGPDEASQSD